MQKQVFNLGSFAVCQCCCSSFSSGSNIPKLLCGNIIYCFCILVSRTRLIFSLLLILVEFSVLTTISFCKGDFFSSSTMSQARVSSGFCSTGT